MPKQIPQIPGMEISGSWRLARIVGGDYFDVFSFSERRVGLCIADVSGKGMPAALLMSNLQAVVKALASEDTFPKELVEKVNPRDVRQYHGSQVHHSVVMVCFMSTARLSAMLMLATTRLF